MDSEVYRRPDLLNGLPAFTRFPFSWRRRALRLDFRGKFKFVKSLKQLDNEVARFVERKILSEALTKG